MKILGAIAASAIFVFSMLAYWRHPFGWYALSAAFAAVIAVVLNFVIEYFLVRLGYRNGALQWLASFALCLLGGPFLWFHLDVVDRYYINWGPQYRPMPSSKTHSSPTLPAEVAVPKPKQAGASAGG